MLLQSVKLKRNGFSTRLIHFVFPHCGIFYNFCPHFWITILSGILSPFVGFYKILKYLLLGAMDIFENALTSFADTLLEYNVNKITPEDLLKIDDDDKWYANFYFNDSNIPTCELSRLEKLREILLRYKIKYSTETEKLKIIEEKKKLADQTSLSIWIEKMKRIRKNQEKRQIERDKKETEKRFKKRERKKFDIAKLVIFTKVLTGILMIPIVIFLLYHVVMFFGWLWYWIHVFFTEYFIQIVISIFYWCLWLVTTSTFLLLISSFSIGAFLALIIIKILPKISFPPEPVWLCITRKKIGKGIIFLLIPFDRVVNFMFKILPPIFEGIGEFFVFFGSWIKTLKSKNCPEIDWQD